MKLESKDLKELTHHLETIKLKGLTQTEHLQLNAFISSYEKIYVQPLALDQNAKIFLMTLQWNQFSDLPINSQTFIWAHLSDSVDPLLAYFNQANGSNFLWDHARSTGMGFWVRDIVGLRKQVELIARNQFMFNNARDPEKCALLYLALRKQKLWVGLWRTATSKPDQQTMIKFLANDFSQERWKTAALKNAFALIGKQRFEYAAAFFILADQLKDAVHVCIRQMGDMQLALVIARLYEGDDGMMVKEIIEHQMLPLALETNDRFLACIAFGFLHDTSKALQSISRPIKDLIIVDEAATSNPLLAPASDNNILSLLILHLFVVTKRRHDFDLRSVYANLLLQVVPNIVWRGD